MVVKKMEGLSNATLEGYSVVLHKFFTYVRKTPDDVTTNDIRLFLYAYSEENKISMRSLNKYREYICRFFSWCKAEGYIDKDPGEAIHEIKHEKKQRKALTPLELEKLRNACANERDSAIIDFLYSTGCRVTELINIKKTDIDWNAKSVHLFGKGQKHRVSFINARAEFALSKYLKSRTDDSDYLFVSIIKPYKQLTKSGVEKIVRELSNLAFGKDGLRVTPHILRHTMATTALQRGMPLADISKLLGHENINTTMIYAETSMENIKSEHTKCVV